MINKTPIIENDLDAITFIAKMVSERSGIQLSERHADMIRSRLLQRQNQLGIPLVQDYLRYLMEHFDSEIKKCISLLTTHHTFFFREFIQFEFLRDRLLQEVIPNVRRRQDKTLRIWSAACSYGQEVYSIATFLKHHLSEFPDINFEVIGSDIDEDAISFAKNGVFQKVSVKDIPRNYLTTGFSQGQGRVESFVKVKKAVHEHCKFHVLNLFDIEPWFLQQKFDIIFCRNVLIYFNHLQTQKIISTLSSMLDPLGFLFLGVSESMDMTNQQFQIAGPSIYTRKQAQKNIPQIDTKLTSQPDISPKTIRVLIVDDSPSVVAIMKKIFTSEQDFEVCGSVSNGVEAREYLNQHSCDVITLDIHMPVQDGKAFLATNYQKSKDPPVVLVTGVSEEQTSIVKECLALGAADYVEKPSVEEFKKASIEIQNKVRAAVMTKAKMNSRNDLAPRNQSQQSYLKNIQVYQSEVHKVFKFFLKKDEVFVGLLTDITQTSHSLGIKFISSRDDDSQWAEFIKLIQEKKQIFSSIKIVLDQDISLGQEIYHKLKSYCKEIKTIPSPPGSEIHFSPFERKILLKKNRKASSRRPSIQY